MAVKGTLSVHAGYLFQWAVIAALAWAPLWAWLFADTTRSAHASASCYSLIETAKANGLESVAYIHHMLEHIATADMLETLKALLPRHMDFEAITKKVA